MILKLLDRGEWSSFRLPKASHAYDPAHGWYTEWPRIRETGQGRMLMDMHGMFYDFPKEFRTGRTNGLRPIASHLRYIPDFCDWNGRLVLAADDASMMQNPMVGQPQSNLWFGSWSDLPSFGPRSGWGGPWSADLVKANEPSDPFLIDGFDRRVLHLAHDSDRSVDFSLEIDAAGDGRWRELETLAVPANGYRYRILDPALEASWMRLRSSADCRATAYFHLNSNRADDRAEGGRIAAGIAGAADRAALSAGLIRPAGHNTNLQFLARRFDADGAGEAQVYYEVDERISFLRPAESRAEEVERIACIAKDFETDAASVVMVWQGRRYRLPKGGSAYDKPFAFGWPRGMREVQSERYLANIHGTFYEIPRDDGVPMIKPVCTHGKQIMDFCSWRGLLVLSGALASARPDGRHFASEDRHVGLWFGAVDDLWILGKPVGCGGPWKETPVLPGQPSDPYLMTGYDRKRLLLSHDSPSAVAFLLEVDVDHNGWLPCETFAVEPGQTIRHDFPEGFGAHWARLTADKACAATAIFQYE
ncbi:MAG: hypothetical protein BWZ10_02467 [candidate division BRC1 bacterium ADurb.BinA364]|nr:MAG: hypothetical protein BWZ10_02467 [candidate division BRC1 bacterium ADurb.BinA364]